MPKLSCYYHVKRNGSNVRPPLVQEKQEEEIFNWKMWKLIKNGDIKQFKRKMLIKKADNTLKKLKKIMNRIEHHKYCQCNGNFEVCCDNKANYLF